jgi:hypothetical protein
MQLFIFTMVSIICILLIFYFTFLQPWQLQWGATDDEANHVMAGDKIVQEPHFIATRAVSIKAPSAEFIGYVSASITYRFS